MVNIIDHSRGNDLGLQAFLLGDIIETKPPSPVQEAGDVLLAALGPGQWAGIVLELAGHEVRVPALGLTVILFPVMLDAEAVSKFMGNCESQRESRVFIDVTAPMRLAHSRQVGQTQGLTRAIDTSTDVFSGEEDSHIMMGRVEVTLRIDALLPLTEAGQCLLRMVGDFQSLLFFLK